MNIIRYLPILLLFAVQATFAAPAEYPGARGKPFEAIQTQLDAIEAALDDQIAALQTQINDLEAQVLANTQDIALLQQWQEAHDQLIGVLATAISRLEHQVAANTSDIAALEAWNFRQDQMLLLLNSRVNSLQQQVLANDQDIDALIRYDAMVQLQIGALQNKVNILNTKINLNAGDIAALETEVNTIKTQITNLQNDLSSKQNLITGYCNSGYSIRRIYSDGTVTCEYDSVSAGVGTLDSISAWSNSVTVPTRSYRSAIATCPSGHRVTGGGFDRSSNLIEIFDNYRWFNGWRIYAFNSSYTNDRQMYAIAVCSRVQ